MLKRTRPGGKSHISLHQQLSGLLNSLAPRQACYTDCIRVRVHGASVGWSFGTILPVKCSKPRDLRASRFSGLGSSSQGVSWPVNLEAPGSPCIPDQKTGHVLGLSSSPGHLGVLFLSFKWNTWVNWQETIHAFNENMLVFRGKIC